MPYVAKCNFDAGKSGACSKGEIYTGEDAEKLLLEGLIELLMEEDKPIVSYEPQKPEVEIAKILEPKIKLPPIPKKKGR